ncbi:hypothetical protein HG536_0B03180 [Torulaspora globosa]|uniref:protein-histidine N-methyltransferase n=1 Tax=Torulaspora globosa TaxID=48254 RepID=A0A7G3ZD69_9SACH|nr:uncharacterized protein HG536_0B03180 [Torulaspora globosa]QLL31455.1 hypothetical protein HG536_0B03180 [Torulaspora globosa]
MSFSFGFSSKDFSDDEIDNDGLLAGSEAVSPASSVNPLDDGRLLGKDVVQPQWQNLKAVLDSLKDVRVSFEQFPTPRNSTVLYRRELFDVKHQLMSEAGDGDEDSVELDILMGETSEDLRKNVYEGGLKSWECSIDVVDYLSELKSGLEDIDCVLELGCGTALPTEYIYSMFLQLQPTTDLTFILSDYNRSVLRLVTIPNLIITWAKVVLSEDQYSQLQKCNDETIPVRSDELLLTQQLLDAFYHDMQARKIRINLMSGTWGRSFTNLLAPTLNAHSGILAITSETIYQPENLPVVAETLLDVILANKGSKVKALVAAKNIYFGVGGSMMEFEKYLQKRIQQDCLPIIYHTQKVDAGLKRSIMFIE